MIKLTGLWKKTDTKGETYYSGSLGVQGRLLLFKNTRKSGDQDPDLVLYMAEKRNRPPATENTEPTIEPIAEPMGTITEPTEPEEAPF